MEGKSMSHVSTSMNDTVNKPAHYTQGSVECIDAIAAALGPVEYRGFLRGQVMKYVWRAPHKTKALEDYRKAEFYLKRLIKQEEENG
jgi:hypothetical protein